LKDQKEIGAGKTITVTTADSTMCVRSFGEDTEAPSAGLSAAKGPLKLDTAALSKFVQKVKEGDKDDDGDDWD